MIHIAIVEDEVDYAVMLEELIQRYAQESEQTIRVSRFADGDEIVEGYTHKYDIILLDVEMKYMDGMTAAEEIRRQDPEVTLMFITNTPQYAVRGYAVDAVDYILKPVSYFALSQRLGRAIARMQKRQKRYIAISVRGGVVKLDVDFIHYIESQGHNLLFHTESGEYVTSGTMKEVEERLDDAHFFRCNKGYLVNLEHVDGIQDGCALIKGRALLISRGRKNDFMQALTNYMGEVI